MLIELPTNKAKNRSLYGNPMEGSLGFKESPGTKTKTGLRVQG